MSKDNNNLTILSGQSVLLPSQNGKRPKTDLVI